MNLINDRKMSQNITPFSGGFLLSIFGISYLDNTTMLLNVDTRNALIYYGFKIVSTLLLGFLGGLAGMYAKDVYKYLKIKFFNKKRTS